MSPGARSTWTAACPGWGDEAPAAEVDTLLRIAERWFERRTLADGITLLWEPHVHPLLRCNVWHVRGETQDLLVDTGLGIASLATELRDLVDKPLLAVASHVHYDHVGSLHGFPQRAMHVLEAGHMANYRVPSAPVTRLLAEGDGIDLGNRRFEVLHLPGHSPGSIGLLDHQAATLFAGDAVYDGQLLDQLPDSSIADYVATMRRLRALPVRVVHAGHEPSFGRARVETMRAGPPYSAMNGSVIRRECAPACS